MNIKELAKKLNVSSSTVSRVLNNENSVSDITRKKVLEGIKKYNYVPSSVARNLSSKSTRNIGLIVPDIQNQFFSDIMAGVSSVANNANFNIFYLGTNEKQELEHKALDTIISERIAGVIITPVASNDKVTLEKLEKISNLNIPVILVDRELDNSNFSGVFVDNIKGTKEAVMKLLEQGTDEIAIITGPNESKPGRERLIGYKKAFETKGLEYKDEYIKEGDFKSDKAYEQTKKLFELPNPPRGLFCSNNLTSLGALKYIEENKYKIGSDISIIGFDDLPILNIVGYKFSVVRRDAKLQGSYAMKLLLDQLKDYNVDRKKINVPYDLVLRGSEKLNK